MRQTTTIETRYLRTLLEVNAQEAGIIVQRFARLALGEADESTGDRFLDYIGAEMAECAARIAEYREDYAQDMAELGRRSGEARRAKRTALNGVERRSQNANGVPETRTALNGVRENANGVELTDTVNRTEPLPLPNQTEPDPTRAGARETGGTGSASGSGSVENRFPLVGSVSGGTGRTADAPPSPPPSPPGAPRHADGDEAFYSALHDRSLDLAGTIAARFGRGAWARYIREIGADAVRMVADTLAHEIAAGEAVGNPAAVLTTRLKALAEDGRAGK